jgi:deoxycytidylate deaminase
MPKYIPTEEEFLTDVPCSYCGKKFTPLSIDDIYCSERCMMDEELFKEMMQEAYEEEMMKNIMEEDYYE